MCTQLFCLIPSTCCKSEFTKPVLVRKRISLFGPYTTSHNTWWTFVKTWDWMKTTLFLCSLSLTSRGTTILPNSPRRIFLWLVWLSEKAWATELRNPLNIQNLGWKRNKICKWVAAALMHSVSGQATSPWLSGHMDYGGGSSQLYCTHTATVGGIVAVPKSPKFDR